MRRMSPFLLIGNHWKRKGRQYRTGLIKSGADTSVGEQLGLVGGADAHLINILISTHTRIYSVPLK